MEPERQSEREASALADLDAADPITVAFAVRRCGELLRDGECSPGDLADLVAKLVRLANDESPRVRQSVAEAAPYFPEAVCRELLPALVADRSPFVRDAAERAVRKRGTLRRGAAEVEEHDARVDRWYRELDGSARAGARRIASHETEYFVRRMVHEASSSRPAFTQAVAKLRGLLGEPEIDRAQARACLDRIEERFAFFHHVLETGRTQARPAPEPELQRVNLHELVVDEASLLAARFPEVGARIRVDASGVDRALVIDADAGFLRQALANVLKNAVEAYDGASVAIAIVIATRLDESAAEVALSIADGGCGMNEEGIARAFVPFGSSKRGGTGFGLFVARRVARTVHGGDLVVTSTLGQGTTVTMTLPLRQELPRKRRARARTARPS